VVQSVRNNGGAVAPSAASLELGTVETGADGTPRAPLYLSASASIDLAGLSYGLGVSGQGSSVPLQFIGTADHAPSLVDADVPGQLAVAWLDRMHIDGGQRLLLGYVVVTGARTVDQFPASFTVFGITANDAAAGRDVSVSWNGYGKEATQQN
jgi:hypothetical protein